MEIPFAELQALTKRYGLTHIIVFACGEDKIENIATYGKSDIQCSQAADLGNKLREQLGWPESLHRQPSRVERLQKRIEELELELLQ